MPLVQSRLTLPKQVQTLFRLVVGSDLLFVEGMEDWDSNSRRMIHYFLHGSESSAFSERYGST